MFLVATMPFLVIGCSFVMAHNIQIASVIAARG
jgi:hypothetical protein